MTEYLDIVDSSDRVLGRAAREVVHGNPLMIHRAVHVLVFDLEGRLYLQKRSMQKYIQPGKWDTSVGGHLASGEDYGQAAEREMAEELGIRGKNPMFLYSYLFSNDIESEQIHTYKLHYHGPIVLHPDEISDGRFWSLSEIESALGSGILTPNFEQELAYYAAWKERDSKQET